MDSIHQKVLGLMANKSGSILDAGTGELSDALKRAGFGVSSCDMASEHFRLEKRAASIYLQLSGCGGRAATVKRAMARLSFFVLYPPMKQKDRMLLKARSIVFLATKVEEC